MEVLQRLNEDIIRVMKRESGVLGAWEFGAGMHHTTDEYSDIDIVFLLSDSDYFRIDCKLKDIVGSVCDNALIFWAEDFNGESIRSYDCLLEREGKLCQYDIFLINIAHIEDYMCRIHYEDLTEENIFFDREGKVASLINKDFNKQTWQDDIPRLIETYWLHIYMTGKYFMRKDYFKLEGILRILMDAHTSLLLSVYDRITWGGAANKLHYLPEEKQAHLKKYYCAEDLDLLIENLWKAMCWFEEDVLELDGGGYEKYNELSEKIKRWWKKTIYMKI